MNWNVLSAIFKRNFVSYFSSPIGYVFICVFVVASSLATFWPPDFFSNNLANLDQLSTYLPAILLFFVPAITMSLWAEERKQGTDELLLTIPASDLDVVLGKYLAAVAIFSVSLLFSALSIYLVFLYGLGSPDVGLFISTFVGYWFIGATMLGIGMVASFLTSNLTISFILGVILNAPLALSGWVDLLVRDPYVATAVAQWSAAERFRDFERGVLSLSGMIYFTLIAVVMVYLSVVLIGRRHWRGGKDGNPMLGHYLARVLCLLAVAVGATLFFSHHDWLRADITYTRISSLSGQTVGILDTLKGDEDVRPIKVDVYVSPRVPAEYVQTKINLLATLDEMSSLSGGKIQVDRHVLEPFDEQAALAEKTFGITPREVQTKSRGERGSEEIFLGVAFTSGLDKVVVPFIDRGIPIEYELARSIATVSDQERKKIGVVKTDVELMGGFSMQGMREESRLITELKKQYEIVEVDPAQEIAIDEYDALLALQPSSLDPQAMDNFVDAVKSGVPTAIFEDPFPWTYPNVPGTAEPKRPPGGMMGMQFQQPPTPKGDINQLWNVLGAELIAGGSDLIWQRYNPYRKVRVPDEWVFIDEGNGALEPFNNESAISRGLKQVLFLYAGAWRQRDSTSTEMEKLATTGSNSGTMSAMELRQSMNPMFGAAMQPARRSTAGEHNVAVHITGKPPEEDVSLSDVDAQLSRAASGGEDGEDAEAEDEVPTAPKELPDLNVVLVADIDWVFSEIFDLRATGENEDYLVNWNFQNVTFVLNILDVLAGEERFVDIRRRERTHRILQSIEEQTEQYRADALEAQEAAVQEAEEAIAERRRQFQAKIDEVDKQEGLTERDRQQLKAMVRAQEERKRDVAINNLENQRQQELKRIERDLALKVRKVQDFYKLCALLIPPIPPLLVAFFVFFHRRKAEQEGVAKSRMR